MTPERAVRILESLVEQGENRAHSNVQANTYLMALVEGAKELLQWHKENHANKPDKYSASQGAVEWNLQNRDKILLIAMTKRYAIRMKEAGMEVPE